MNLSTQLAGLKFEEQVLLLNALRKAIDRCLSEQAKLQELLPGCSDRYWLEHGRDIYRLYRKLDGLEIYLEFERN